MKRLLLFFIAFTISFSTMAQEKAKEVGKLQLGVFGGISMPLGDYKDSIGRANNGITGGMFMDKYFRGDKFGIGIDARYLQHKSQPFDSVKFANGSINPNYNNTQTFKHLGVSIGPTYKFTSNQFSLEAFVKGGVVFQQFPNYDQTLTYSTPGGGGSTSVKVLETINPNDKSKAWMGVGGMRFNYLLAKNLDLFAQVDYLRTFGKKFGKDESEFQIQRYNQTRPIPGAGGGKGENEEDYMWSHSEYYEKAPVIAKTFVQALNASIGIKYSFGKIAEKIIPKPVAIVAVKKVNKDIQVVVKDKQTGIALSGVKVIIKKADDRFTSITNSNGEADRVKEVMADTYIIQGEKNGILTNEIIITEDEFKSASTTIYKELLHDDPRFTLIGNTVECEGSSPLSGISTVLTHQGNKENMRQISDAEGKFIYQLNQNASYYVVANQEKKYSQTEEVSTMGLDRSKTLYVTLKLGVCDIQEGANWVLKNIHYDFDKSNIRTDAASILDNVVSVLKQNPSLKIELSSHTDSRGNDQYNMSLSQRRAQSAVDYLVANGIDRSRLVAKGYGESRLLNSCGNGATCSEEQHQENRRTEITVLKY